MGTGSLQRVSCGGLAADVSAVGSRGSSKGGRHAPQSEVCLLPQNMKFWASVTGHLGLKFSGFMSKTVYLYI